jgi:hypothetical protein
VRQAGAAAERRPAVEQAGVAAARRRHRGGRRVSQRLLQRALADKIEGIPAAIIVVSATANGATLINTVSTFVDASISAA